MPEKAPPTRLERKHLQHKNDQRNGHCRQASGRRDTRASGVPSAARLRGAVAADGEARAADGRWGRRRWAARHAVVLSPARLHRLQRSVARADTSDRRLLSAPVICIAQAHRSESASVERLRGSRPFSVHPHADFSEHFTFGCRPVASRFAARHATVGTNADCSARSSGLSSQLAPRGASAGECRQKSTIDPTYRGRVKRRRRQRGDFISPYEAGRRSSRPRYRSHQAQLEDRRGASVRSIAGSICTTAMPDNSNARSSGNQPYEERLSRRSFPR